VRTLAKDRVECGELKAGRQRLLVGHGGSSGRLMFSDRDRLVLWAPAGK
jgi:hypothetical protein